MIKILTISTLYPNSIMQNFGIFVENRLRQLLASGRVSSTVIAPVPWFPFEGEVFGDYAKWSRVPRQEIRHGIKVFHPRYINIPKIGMYYQHRSLLRTLRSSVRKLEKKGLEFDLIDAHYFYPDGVAAVSLAKEVDKPVIVTARGTDLNLYPYRFPKIRKEIIEAATNADGLITVCSALKDVLVEFGLPDEKVRVLRNGVDLELFRPLQREALRAELSIKGPALASVGHLIGRKGHDIAIEALVELPQFELLIVGEGPKREQLEKLAAKFEVGRRVRFMGNIPQFELPKIYNAVDALVLASSREGWANVLLESLACGTPVIASNIWGTPEVVASPEAGILVPQRSATAFAKATKELMANPRRRDKTRKYAENFSWFETTMGQLEFFSKILNRPLI